MYDIVLTDRSYVPQGPITGATQFQFFRGLSKLSTVAFRVPLEHVHEARLATLDGFIKLYRDGVLVYVGPIVSAEETAEREARTLAVTSADAGWVLGKRVAGKSATGTLYTTVTGRHVIAKALVDAANAEANTGVNTGAYTYTSGSSITHKVRYDNLLSQVQELGNSLDGYDWIVRPRENWVNGALAEVLSATTIGSLQIATLIGVNQANAVFEYGRTTRSNVVDYTITRTRDQQCNKAWHVSATDGSSTVGTNGTALTAWGLMEDVISGEFTDANYRQSLVNEHVAVRGNPRTLVRMTPHIDPDASGRVPLPFVDYDVGDTIQFRAVHAGVVRFGGILRVFGIRISIDTAGFERVELVLEEE